MKTSIRKRLLYSYVAIIFLVLLSIIFTIFISLPTAYGRHLGQMEMMLDNTRPGEMRNLIAGRASELFRNFRLSFIEALAWAILISLPVAFITSYFMSSSLIAPLRAMIHASQRISDGHYQERVPAAGNDELGNLSSSFNSMAEKLENVETRRRQLIGDVAHELRTPLSIIKGSMEGLIDGILPEGPETYTQIINEAERLTRLVDDLQELSRVELGKISLDLHDVDLSELLKISQERISPAFQKKGIGLKVILSGENVSIHVDVDRILQVLNNILVNSLQYTPRGGDVIVETILNNTDVLITVKDNGIGISKEDLPLLFDRFYRADKARTRMEGGGSGIGLTISKQIMEAHGGRLWVESPGKGKGSTFFIRIPLQSIDGQKKDEG